MMPGFAFDPPPEVVEEMKRQHAERVAFRDSIRHMLQELDTHHMWVIKGMLNGIVNADEAQARIGASHFAGMLVAHLEMRGVCGGCGVDHITEDLKRMDPEIPHQQGPSLDESIEVPEIDPEIQMDMDANGVRPDPTPDQPKRVTCVGICGGSMHWSSIEDRMGERPNVCPHCAERTKFG